MVIAMDGPAGAGKGTVAKFLAKELSLTYVDSGLLYRAWAFAQTDAQPLPLDCFAPVWHFLNTGHDPDGVIARLRSESVGQFASKVSRDPAVRELITKTIRNFSRAHDLVIDGRDTTTVIFPDADIKLFVTATLDVRARRRCLEMNESLDRLPLYRQHLQQRDEQDCTRTLAPLVQAPDAFVLDTSDLTIAQACTKALQIVKTLGFPVG